MSFCRRRHSIFKKKRASSTEKLSVILVGMDKILCELKATSSLSHRTQCIPSALSFNFVDCCLQSSMAMSSWSSRALVSVDLLKPRVQKVIPKTCEKTENFIGVYLVYTAPPIYTPLLTYRNLIFLSYCHMLQWACCPTAIVQTVSSSTRKDSEPSTVVKPSHSEPLWHQKKTTHTQTN